jgi:hypothetical protein
MQFFRKVRGEEQWFTRQKRINDQQDRCRKTENEPKVGRRLNERFKFSAESVAFILQLDDERGLSWALLIRFSPTNYSTIPLME